MDNDFARLNAMGEVADRPADRPAINTSDNTRRQVGILYGHTKGGKVYNYLACDGVRAGDTVTPEVTHYKSGKTYKTLGHVVMTRSASGGPAGDTAAHLESQGIPLKTLGPTNQASLPGYKARKQQDPSFTARRWAEEAQERYDNAVMRRLNPFGEET